MAWIPFFNTTCLFAKSTPTVVKVDSLNVFFLYLERRDDFPTLPLPIIQILNCKVSFGVGDGDGDGEEDMVCVVGC